MGVFVQAIPTLEGVTAEQFIKKSDQNLLRKGSVDFSEQYAKSKAILEKKTKRHSRK